MGAQDDGDLVTGNLGDNVTYSLDRSTGVLTVSPVGAQGAIPDYFCHVDTSRSPLYTAEIRLDITSIVVEPGVTKIGNGAFHSCNNVGSITLPEGLTRIGEYAFAWNGYGGGDLTPIDLTIPSSVNSMGRCAFIRCYGLNSVTFAAESELKELLDSTFLYCGHLKSVSLPAGLTTIEESAFCYCDELDGIEIPKTVKSIGHHAFDDCVSLKTITFEESSELTSMGSLVFGGCKALKSIALPDNLKVIPGSAFVNCSSLETVVLPSGLEKIDSFAFNGLVKLENVDFTRCPNLESIGWCSFGDCNKLQSVDLSQCTSLVSIGDKAFGNPNYILGGCASLQSVVLPESIKSIGAGAFERCTSLETIDLPESLESIGVGAFKNCTGMSGTVAIPDGVTSIPDSLFSGCTSLTGVDLPDSVTSIGTNAFNGCTSLEAIDLPEGLQSIGDKAFAGCENLDDVTIPSSVTSVGSGVFDGCGEIQITRAKVAKPAAVTGLVYNNAEQEGVAVVSPYTVVGGKATEAGDYTATVTLKSIEYYEWDDGTTDALSIPWSIARADIAKASVTGLKASYAYTGKAIAPAVKATVSGTALVPGTDFTVSYRNNVKVGTATVTVTGKGNYVGTATATFKVVKAKNPITVKGKAAKVKAATVGKRAVKLSAKKVLTVKGAKGKVTYKKVKGNKKIRISKAGRVTVGKGLKKGLYKVRVRVTAAGNAGYKAGSRTAVFKVRVR